VHVVCCGQHGRGCYMSILGGSDREGGYMRRDGIRGGICVSVYTQRWSMLTCRELLRCARGSEGVAPAGE
jgi:hypothetical protein